jgi:hypothetical protein
MHAAIIKRHMEFSRGRDELNRNKPCLSCLHGDDTGLLYLYCISELTATAPGGKLQGDKRLIKRGTGSAPSYLSHGTERQGER